MLVSRSVTNIKCLSMEKINDFFHKIGFNTRGKYKSPTIINKRFNS